MTYKSSYNESPTKQYDMVSVAHNDVIMLLYIVGIQIFIMGIVPTVLIIWSILITIP